MVPQGAILGALGHHFSDNFAFVSYFCGCCFTRAFPSGFRMTFGGQSVQKWGSPGGVNMHSVHACAGFMKVGPFSKKLPPERLREPISEIWGPFWEAFGSTLRTFGRPGGHLLPHGVFTTFFYDFNGKRAPLGKVGGKGEGTCGLQGIVHFVPWTVVFLCVFERSAWRVPAQPQGEVTFSDFCPKFPYRNL